MAQKRMFDKSIIETDSFLDMPMATKALYFLLGMEADDEGFVSPKRVMRIYGGNEDDLKLLIVKNFVISFKSGVVVITNWNENNYLDKNRIKATRYSEEKRQLEIKDNRYSMLNNCLTDVEQPFNQYSIEESRVEENRVVEKRIKIDDSETSSVSLPDLINDKKRHVHIIGLFSKEKGLVFENTNQQSSFIKRNARIASLLVGYTDEQITATMKHLTKDSENDAKYPWSLETVGKRIDLVKANINPTTGRENYFDIKNKRKL